MCGDECGTDERQERQVWRSVAWMYPQIGSKWTVSHHANFAVLFCEFLFYHKGTDKTQCSVYSRNELSK